jgi:pyruvate,water dikinase
MNLTNYVTLMHMHVVSLNETLAISESSGGKGKQLALLLAEGLPVPAGFVVQSGAFDRFVSNSGIHEDLTRITHDTTAIDPTTLTSLASEFTLRMNTLLFPDELSQEIDTALETLASQTFAVRSSANIEDGTRSAWAGQFETLLSVPQSEVMNAVRQVWTSFCSPRALAALSGTRVTKFHMAVIIQTMIQPRISGVLFTIDPVERENNCIIIEAVTGHNSALVDGSITPDHYTLSRDTFSVRTQDTVRHAEPVLSVDELRSLGAMGLHIETLLGVPADIEWAFDGDTLKILQARPITGISYT